MTAAIFPDLTQKLDTLPDRPGCYIYRSADRKVIYVGKAVVLRNRVRSYFHESARHEPRTRRLVAEIADLEWIVTDTELEALILENELIKRYRPRFNVRLKDDKTYPYIKVHWQEDFPEGQHRAAHGAGRRPLLRPLHLGLGRAPDAGGAAPRVPLPGLHPRDHRPGPQAVPLLPHQALRGAVHRRGGPGGLPADHRGAGRVPGRETARRCWRS